MSIADLVSPAPYYQSFEEFQRIYIETKDKNEPAKSETELRADYNAMVEYEKEKEKQRAINSLMKSFGWIIIPLPIFIYFQRRLRKKE